MLPPLREALETRWLFLTRETLPGLAVERGWPVHANHCFQRILLDAVHGGRWDGFVTGRPAYRCMGDDKLVAAVALAEAVIAGNADLHALNRASLVRRRNPNAA